MLLLISIAGSILIGVALAFSQFHFFIKIMLLVVLFCISNILINWRYFTNESGAWITTFFTGIVQTGIGSLLAHIMPAIVAYYVTLFFFKKRQSQP